MGTRADFYMGRGKDAEWLGSIAWDGYPEGIDKKILLAEIESEFRNFVSTFLQREDGTLPEQGWPWPWEDSNTSDYAYAFDNGVVYGTCFGHGWWVAKDGEPQDQEEDIPKITDWPNMKDRQNVTLGKRSGLMVFSVPS